MSSHHGPGFILPGFPLPIGVKRIERAGSDTDISNVVLLASFEGTDGDTSYNEQAHGRALSFGSGTTISSTHSEYGATSFKSFNGATATWADNTDWDLANANSDPYTIEYSLYQTDTASTYDPFGQFPGAGNFAYLARHNATTLQFYWSADGSALLGPIQATSAIPSANTWHKYCIEHNGSGKIRLYVNGTMVASSTPADSTIFNSTGALTIGSAGAGQSSWMDNLRVTKGVARYDSDGGYTPATAAFPDH
jgi:hypothetical protein